MLRKQKELEKRIFKLSGVLENIQSLLYKVQDTEADSEVCTSKIFYVIQLFRINIWSNFFSDITVL